MNEGTVSKPDEFNAARQVSRSQGVELLPGDGIDEMIARRDDLPYIEALCHSMMAEKMILPYPFERLAVLLRKAGRLQDEIELCRYVRSWSETAERNYASGAMVWRSPRLERIIARQAKAEKALSRSKSGARSS